ncbi:ribosome-associated translation inhibitor RaiA [Candidatus Uhrbacteria bacterium]|nr:ribosome-associated translation inhibitor RaiA [Candidatus Uhrbacteria bacterium]
MKITIRTKDVELSDDIKQYVEDKIGTLDKYYHRITDGYVDLERYTNHHKNGPFYRAFVDLRLPHKILRAEKNHIDLKSALDGIKDELKKQLKSYKDLLEMKEKKGGRLFKEMRMAEMTV